MQYTPRIHKAIRHAARWHDGQVRKSDNETPYVTHLFSVSFILAEYTNNEDLIIAALFHDVLEDVSLDYAKQIQDKFGESVLALVKEVSEDKDPETDEERPWQKRKQEYLDGLEEHSKDAVLLSCADKAHNLIALRTSYKRKGEAALAPFNSSVEDRLWFYGEVVRVAKERLENDITDRLESEYTKTKETVLS